MKRPVLALLAIAASLALSACGPLDHPTTAGEIVVKAGTTLDKVEADYAKVKAIVDLVEPSLPAALVKRIHAIEAKIESALALAHKAVTAAEQLAHLRDAAAAIAELNGAPAGTAAP